MNPDLAATLLILSSALMHAISSSLYRIAGDRMVRMIVGCILGLSIMLPIAFFVPLPTAEAWQLIIPSSIIIIFYQFMVIKALEHGELSYTYPVSRGSAPVFVVLLTLLFFSHELVWVEILGVAMVAGGIMELALRSFKIGSVQGNLKKATIFSFISGLTTAIYTLIDAQGVRLVENPFSYIAWLFIIINTGLILIIGLKRGRSFFKSVYTERRHGTYAGLFGIASYVTALLALRLGNTVEIAALRETSIMFAILIGYFFLGEGIGIRRWIAVALISLGAITIKSF
jgi:drug/metabolite transporter (DMT)-like permease